MQSVSWEPNPRTQNSPSTPMTPITNQSLLHLALLFSSWLSVRALIWLDHPAGKIPWLFLLLSTLKLQSKCQKPPPHYFSTFDTELPVTHSLLGLFLCYLPASGSTAAALFFLPLLWLEHTRCPYSSRNLTSNFKQIHTNTYYTYTIHTLYWNDSPCTRLTCIRKETGVQNSFLINIATGEGKAGSKRFRWLDICQLSFFGTFSWTGTKWVNYASSGNKTGIPEKPIRMQDPLHLAYSRSQPFNNVTHDHDQFMNAAIAKARSYIPAKMKRWSEWVCDHETPFLFRLWW